ncbi:MAG: prolyl aminopeptidase [Burkholderiales bacterium]|nr:prolyl aminopeptidase [Burkholderiales bacterium]
MSLYPSIQPFHSDHLAVTGGHRIAFEQSGNPDGMPVLFLHGGPGSSSKPDHRRYFDPSFYRIVLFDQRGCGRSEPAGGLDCNTTDHLVDDIERLRITLGIDRWVLFGGSWGSTLALAYAQAHPGQVRHLILRGIFLASHSELDWYFVGLRQFLPEAWEELWSEAPGRTWQQLVRRYETLLRGPDASRAAARWSAYETAIMSIGEAQPMAPPANGDAALVARARVQVHYLAHDSFLRPGQLLDGVATIAHLPAILLHGRMDFVCPPVTAHALARRWPNARLTFVEQAKHASSHPALERTLVAAADAVRDRLRGAGGG